jgi:hypothetical protein
LSGLKAALADGLFQLLPWYSELVDDSREIPSSELLAGMHPSDSRKTRLGVYLSKGTPG